MNHIKNLSSLLILPMLTLLSGCGGQFGTYHLVPGEARTIELRTNQATTVSVALVEHSEAHERARQCPQGVCLALEQVGTLNRLDSMYGGKLEVRPRNGRTGLVLRNLADFDIEVEVQKSSS
ncbi:MAG: hypothetical protein KDK91_17055 [Gammaproteobacteria bacterium]|nr:hypothetical protein [Gammaproteobacteria bacterium]